jgi:hypothetical protein
VRSRSQFDQATFAYNVFCAIVGVTYAAFILYFFVVFPSVAKGGP